MPKPSSYTLSRDTLLYLRQKYTRALYEESGAVYERFLAHYALYLKGQAARENRYLAGTVSRLTPGRSV